MALAGFGLAFASSKTIPTLYVIEKMVYYIHVNADATSVKTIEMQTLIKDQLVVDVLANEEVVFNHTYEDVEILDAYTILPSGQKVMVDPKAIRLVDMDTESNSVKFTELKKYTIIFPQVTPGARVYYKSRTVKHKATLPGYFQIKLTVHPEIEYGHVQLNLSHDPEIKIYKYDRDLPGGRIENGKQGEIRYRYSYQQPKIARNEVSQISYSDFAPSVAFSSLETPAELGAMLENLYAPKLAVTPIVQKMADEITSGITDKKAQARAIYNWVNKNIRYIALFLGDGGLIANDAETILKNRYGDCKDHNVLLIALLAAKDIHAISVSVNLGDKFESPALGTVSPFNHEITYIPQWDLYLDSTQELLPFGVLSTSITDKPTLLAALGKLGRTPNLSAKTNRTVSYSKLSIAKDGLTSGTSKTEFAGAHEYQARVRYAGYKGQSKESLVRKHLNQFNEIGTGQYHPGDVYNLDTPFSVESEFTVSPMSNFPGPGAMMMPIGLATGSLTLRGYANPDFEATRPFLCSSYAYEEHFELVFDPAIKITKIPEGTTFRIQDADMDMRYASTYARDGQLVRVSRSLQSQQSSRVCQPEKMQAMQAIHRAVRRDILSQIFYE